MSIESAGRPAGGGSRHLRARQDGEQATTPVELFFDLVYVLAITQLSHLLLGRLDVSGLAETVFLLLVVWWAWVNTTWITNLFDPASTPVRLLLVAGMAPSLVVASALPRAPGPDGLPFALGYVVLQVGRNAGALALLGRADPLRRPVARLTVWSIASGVLWIAGDVATGASRWILWAAALAVDVTGPRVQYATPLLGRGTTSDWDVEGGHFAERFQLFVLIALGESVAVAGVSASKAGLSAATILALVAALAGTAALWWLYFEQVARTSQRIMAGHGEAGRLARDAFTYLHIPIVAGIVGAAVGTELVIAHPGRALAGMGLAVVIGAPFAYLGGEAGFRWVMARRVSGLRLGAMALIALLAVPALALPAILTELALSGVLGGLALLEYRANRPDAS